MGTLILRLSVRQNKTPCILLPKDSDGNALSHAPDFEAFSKLK